MAVVVGLTGGIASGKSAAADLLAQHGAVIIDADILSREAVAPHTPGLAAVVDRFGPGVLAHDGTLDRPRLGALVFADADARRDLEAIIHPAVRTRAADLVTAATAADPNATIVQVIPLLVETGQEHSFDCCVVVDVPADVQLSRLLGRRSGPDDRGLTHDQAIARIGAQLDRATRLAAATWVIDNGHGREHLLDEVGRLWAHLHPHAPHRGYGADRRA